MMKTNHFKFDKLIRDRSPQFLQDSGINVFHRVMGQDEFIRQLKQKLLEEVQEVHTALSPEEMLEELADLLEVIYALTTCQGFSLADLEAQRLQKKEARGGFEGRLYIAAVEIPENHPYLSYYRANPEKYPELNQG
ncbi:nucleoside triphosphate pyrophosphohydrolase [Candidatus Odyssella thessalonicensis]|uniref:nucleoside triphosphate pyrophosphohydrolase n=1 Tax=Candidatus Odyssella thessalonicensis TaxID=84647 RepID=UPI000A0419D3|nr:nucleoside triphosphate pyrophosphohydrolase [Candidatus Odyssella thessalonicensis]